MSPDFALAVDPIFLHVIDLLDRISRNECSSPDSERDGVDSCLRDAEARLGDRPDWQLAKYALVSWIDEVLKQAPWEGSAWWTENSLEFAHFRSNDASVEFYRRAKEAAALPRRDALEVFYVCVVLGFRGLYHLQDKAFLAEHLQMPPEVESWANRAARSIRSGQGRTELEDFSQSIGGAPPLMGRYRLVAMCLAGIVLAAFLAVLGFYLRLA